MTKKKVLHSSFLGIAQRGRMQKKPKKTSHVHIEGREKTFSTIDIWGEENFPQCIRIKEWVLI